jgi:hypothetical protein
MTLGETLRAQCHAAGKAVHRVLALHGLVSVYRGSEIDPDKYENSL